MAIEPKSWDHAYASYKDLGTCCNVVPCLVKTFLKAFVIALHAVRNSKDRRFLHYNIVKLCIPVCCYPCKNGFYF